MFYKTIAKIIKGGWRGILAAFLTGLISPLLIEGINLVIELINHSKLILTFLIIPEAYLVAFFMAFICFLPSCIILGIILEFTFSKGQLHTPIIIVTSGVSSFFIWTFAFRAFVSDSYILPLVIMVVLFQYLYFLVWRQHISQ